MEPRFPFELMEPSAVNAAVVGGRAFGGLMSAAAFARTRGLVRVPGFEIACDGPVRSILLVSRGPRRGLRRVFVTTASASSVALLERLLSAEGLMPALVPAAEPLGALETDTDGALLIGDPALAVDHASWRTWDLGEWWQAVTGLPMVFAVVAVREEEQERIPALREALESSLAWSSAHIDEVIAEWYAREAGKAEGDAERTTLADARGYLDSFAAARRHERLEEGLAAFTVGLGAGGRKGS